MGADNAPPMALTVENGGQDGVGKLPSRPSRAYINEALDAVGDGERDNFKIISKANDRLKRVGLSMPGVEVRWNNLRVELTPPPKSLSQVLRGGSKCSSSCKASNSPVILNVGSGVLSPGRMCLLLGPPGSGRTTLLKALAGQLVPPTTLAMPACTSARADADNGGRPRKAGRIRMYGSVLYNGLQADGSAFEVPRAATYVGQTENHLPELTVADTLKFAADCQGAGMQKRMQAHLQQTEAKANITPNDPDLEMVMALFQGSASSQLIVEGFARMLGIDHVMDTVVGNEMLKGISGGQKRRVTCGEMAVGLAQVMMLDEISNGLDANATLSIVKSLRNMCEHANTTMMATLLQPAPEVVACFHDVMLLAAGRVVFYGPTDQLQVFFARLALAPLPQQYMADFAQEVVASPDDQAVYRVTPPPGAPPAPWAGRKWLSPKRIQQAFEASEYGTVVANAVATQPYSHLLQNFVLHKERYGTSTLAMWLTVWKRELKLFLCNKAFLVAGTVQTAFVAFLVSTAFVNLKHNDFNDANLFMSVLFYSLMAIFMGGFNFAPIYCQRLPVFYKQRDHRFYSAASYAVSSVFMRMPEVVLQSITYGIMVYFSVGLTRDVGRFFIFLLNLIMAGFNGAVIFQMVASLVRNEAATQGIGAMFMMSGVLVSGFPIAPSSIPGWWIWFHWLTPMSWNLRSLLVNELTSTAWPADSNTPGKTVGQAALEMRGIQTEWKWVWAGIGYVAGLTLVQLGIQILALTYLGPLRSSNDGPEYNDEDEHDPRRSFTLQQNGSGHVRASGIELQPTGSAGITVTNGNGAQPQVNGAKRNGDTAILEIAVAPKNSSGGGSGAGDTSSDELQTAGNGENGYGATPASPVSPAAVAATATRGMNPNDGAEHDLGFRPVVLAFKNVAYFVVPQGESKELQLLDGVSGVFRPGVLTSLMGASGAGKTTLMDVLAGRKTGGRITGTQLVNGEPKRMATFARLMGYVEQLDVHNPHTTVEEALLFSARLRVSSDLLPASEVKPFVQHMMKVVELVPLANRIIGQPGPGGGLSTEARKRLTIAVELVANPSIVFMDEPTSGLDARAAGMVMRAVRNTVATGRTVVCTIHQPNRDIMNQFDELLLLKPGGRTIYFGPLGELQTNLVSYLSNLPGVGGYESYMNPANWMLEVTSPAAESALGVDFTDVWAKSEQARLADNLIDQHYVSTSTAIAAEDSDRGSGPPKPRAAFPSPKSAGPAAGTDIEAGTTAGALAKTNTDDDACGAQRFAQPSVRQLWLLLERGIVTQWRNAPYNNMRFAATFIIGWVLGSLYWGRGLRRDTEVAVFDIMGLIFSGAINLPMINLMMIMPEVLAQRPVFYREKASGMYRAALFAMAQGTAEMPFIFVQSVLYVVIVYCSVHFEFIWVKALWFWFYTWLGMLVASFLGTASANLTPNIPAAIALCSGFVLLWMIFCGFLISRKNMPKWYLWAYYGNPFTYIIYGCVVSQLGDLTEELISVQGGTKSVAQYIKDMMVYDYEFRGWIVLILVGFVAVFRLGAYFGLMRLNLQNR